MLDLLSVIVLPGQVINSFSSVVMAWLLCTIKLIIFPPRVSTSGFLELVNVQFGQLPSRQHLFNTFMRKINPQFHSRYVRYNVYGPVTFGCGIKYGLNKTIVRY